MTLQMYNNCNRFVGFPVKCELCFVSCYLSTLSKILSLQEVLDRILVGSLQARGGRS